MVKRVLAILNIGITQKLVFIAYMPLISDLFGTNDYFPFKEVERSIMNQWNTMKSMVNACSAWNKICTNRKVKNFMELVCNFSVDRFQKKNVPHSAQAIRVLSESTKIIGIVRVVFAFYLIKNWKFVSLEAKETTFSCAWKIIFPSADFKKIKNVPQATRVLSESTKIIGSYK